MNKIINYMNKLNTLLILQNKQILKPCYKTHYYYIDLFNHKKIIYNYANTYYEFIYYVNKKRNLYIDFPTSIECNKFIKSINLRFYNTTTKLIIFNIDLKMLSKLIIKLYKFICN